MAENYFDDEQTDNLKKGLYDYLKDKASRRSMVTGTKAYNKMQEGFEKQENMNAMGSFADALSDSASMAGTLGGKRSETGSIGKLNKSLYDGAQNKFGNYAKMRGMEEQSNMNDLSTARYMSGLEQYDDKHKMDLETQGSQMQTADLQRQQLRKNLLDKYKIDDSMQYPGGVPAALDDYGNAKPVEGPKFRPLSQTKNANAGSWSVAPATGSDPNQVTMQNSKTGEFKVQNLPQGFNRTKQSADDKGSTDVAKNFETSYAKRSQIAAVIEREMEIFNKLVKEGKHDAAVRHGEGTLKALNSAFGADAVGVEESKRLGGFLKPFKAPWEAGSMIGRDMDMFSAQLGEKALALRNAAQDDFKRAKAAREGGLEALGKVEGSGITEFDKMSNAQLDEELKKKGLIK